MIVHLIRILAAAAIMAASPACAEAIRPFRGAESWQAIRDANRGHLVLVHFWGITCAPCRVEMPVWAQALKEHPSLRLITVHADRAPDSTDAIIDMLRATGLEKPESWYFSERFQEPLRYAVDPGWVGEIPMTIVLAPDGTIESLVGSLDLEQISALLHRYRAK